MLVGIDAFNFSGAFIGCVVGVAINLILEISIVGD